MSRQRPKLSHRTYISHNRSTHFLPSHSVHINTYSLVVSAINKICLHRFISAACRKPNKIVVFLTQLPHELIIDTKLITYTKITGLTAKVKPST